MARISGIDLPLNKRVDVGLTYIFGIGRTRSTRILAKAAVDPNIRVKDLSEEDVRKIRQVIQDEGNVEGDLRKNVGLDIKRLMEIGCYRGIRHLGTPVMVAADHPSEFFAVNHSVFFDMSEAGVVVALNGSRGNDAGTLRLVDRASGRMTSMRDSIGVRPRFAPDGRSIVAEDSAQQWIYDLTHEGTRTRFSRLGISYVPVWSPDGSHIVMSTYDGGAAQLWSYPVTKPADGTRLSPSARRRFASSFTPDGHEMAFVELATSFVNLRQGRSSNGFTGAMARRRFISSATRVRTT